MAACSQLYLVNTIASNQTPKSPELKEKENEFRAIDPLDLIG
jgi:hypothetical protein